MNRRFESISGVPAKKGRAARRARRAPARARTAWPGARVRAERVAPPPRRVRSRVWPRAVPRRRLVFRRNVPLRFSSPRRLSSPWLEPSRSATRSSRSHAPVHVPVESPYRRRRSSRIGRSRARPSSCRTCRPPLFPSIAKLEVPLGAAPIPPRASPRVPRRVTRAPGRAPRARLSAALILRDVCPSTRRRRRRTLRAPHIFHPKPRTCGEGFGVRVRSPRTSRPRPIV